MSYQHVISVNDLIVQINEPYLVIFDCRFSIQEPELGYQEYLEGHIPGAIYASLDRDLTGKIIPGTTGRHPMPDVSEMVDQLSSWGVNQDSQVVLYDHSSGAFAARLWWILNWLGHERAAILDGGWEAWKMSGEEIEIEVRNPVPDDFIPEVRDDIYVDADFVDSIRLAPDYLLLDARAEERYNGIGETIDPIAGHIPGAISAPYHDNLNEEGFFKSKAELQERFERLLGDRTPAKTIVYCGSGVTAIHNIIALRRAGYEMAKLYPGSWSEWITDPERLIAP